MVDGLGREGGKQRAKPLDELIMSKRTEKKKTKSVTKRIGKGTEWKESRQQQKNEVRYREVVEMESFKTVNNCQNISEQKKKRKKNKNTLKTESH